MRQANGTKYIHMNDQGAYLDEIRLTDDTKYLHKNEQGAYLHEMRLANGTKYLHKNNQGAYLGLPEFRFSFHRHGLPTVSIQ